MLRPPTKERSNGVWLTRVLLLVLLGAAVTVVGFLGHQLWAHEGRIARVESCIELVDFKVDLILEHMRIPVPTNLSKEKPCQQ